MSSLEQLESSLAIALALASDWEVLGVQGLPSPDQELGLQRPAGGEPKKHSAHLSLLK